MNHPRYTGTAMFVHWLVALLIFAGFGLGLTMVEMGFSPQKLKFYSWHKWIGITIGLVLFLWVASGLAMLVPLSPTVWGADLVEPTLDLAGVTITPSQAAAIAVPPHRLPSISASPASWPTRVRGTSQP